MEKTKFNSSDDEESFNQSEAPLKLDAVTTFKAYQNQISCMLLLKKSNTPVSTGFDKLIRVFSPYSYKTKKIIHLEHNTSCLAELQDLLLGGGSSDEVIIWDSRRNFIILRKIDTGTDVYAMNTLASNSILCTASLLSLLITEENAQVKDVKSQCILYQSLQTQF